MLVPNRSQDVHVERNATTALAILTLASFMALTAMLLILHYDRFLDAPEKPVATQGLPSN
jgi:hypothetical protein